MNKFCCAVCLASWAFAACAEGPSPIPYSSGMTATGTSEFEPARGFVHAIDGSGLVDLGNGAWGHTKDHQGTMWMTKGGSVNASSPVYFCVDLGKVYRLDGIKIWNYNQDGQQKRGFRATEVYLSPDASVAQSSPSDVRGWGAPVWTGELSKATGDRDVGCEPLELFGACARHVGLVATSNHDGDGYCGLAEIQFFGQEKHAGDPDLAEAAVKPTPDGTGLVAEVRLEDAAEEAAVTVLAFAAPDAEAVRLPFATWAQPGVTATSRLEALPENATCAIRFETSNSLATLTNAVKEAVFAYAGVPRLAFKADGQESPRVPAEVTVSRASPDPYPLVIGYSLSSADGVAGVDFETPAGMVTIPANETSAVIPVVPLVNVDKAEDVHVTVSLTPGLYFTAGADPVAVTIANANLPDANVWVAKSDSDGLASTEGNWSRGVPRADVPESLVILVDGDYSSRDLVWDADGSTSLAGTVTSWTQTRTYSGTVTVKTTYPAQPSAFKTLKVTGAMTVEGGTLTHPPSELENPPASLTLETLRAVSRYRLCLEAGTFTLGPGARLDAKGKGLYLPRKELAPSHGGRLEDGNPVGCYGNPKRPEDIGLAGNLGTDTPAKFGRGGGAVKLTVDDTCTIDGEIDVDGVRSSGSLAAGAAGSVLIEARRVTGKGLVHADGVYCGNTSYRNGAAGRVAVLTREPLDGASVTLSASGRPDGKGSVSGTVFVRDATMTNGVLFLGSRFSTTAAATRNRGTFVTSEPGVDWTFDRIVFSGNAQLCVPKGATLTLPNGFASVQAPVGEGNPKAGIFAMGGVIDAGTGSQTLSGNWYFAPIAEYAFPASVTLEGGARIGFSGYLEQSLARDEEPSTNAVWGVRCSVAGDLLVADAKSGFDVSQAGPTQDAGHQFADVAIGHHGGRRTATGLTLGSVFSPVLAPVGQLNSYSYLKPGASLAVTVGGDLTLNGGTVNANPVNTQSGGYELAAGGGLDFTVGRLLGQGAFEARGFRNGQCGGRIAVRLTKPGATFESFRGTFDARTAASAQDSTPGSVYLETAEEGRRGGAVVLDNFEGKVTGLSVPICANGYGADEVAAFKRAALVIRRGAYAQVSVADAKGAFTMRSLEMDGCSRLDLCGRHLVVKSARINGRRIKPRTYAATDAAVSSFVVDTSEGGTGALTVIGKGFAVLVR